MAQRITYRRRHSYNTKSNRFKAVRTPGGRLVAHYRKKKAGAPKCGECKCKLQGIPTLRPHEYSRLLKSQRTVARAYGGTQCGGCVRNRIVRAFLVEEQKIVQSVLKQREAAQAKK
jgi:large subunit ribosomal protein L34e